MENYPTIPASDEGLIEETLDPENRDELRATEFAELGIQLSRGFRVLKAWMSLKTDGSLKYRRLIEQNVEQARYLQSLITAHPKARASRARAAQCRLLSLHRR
jgi:glutamate/tyrosine decarboxylase-like PLP-dependent enzyme